MLTVGSSQKFVANREQPADAAHSSGLENEVPGVSHLRAPFRTRGLCVGEVWAIKAFLPGVKDRVAITIAEA